MTPYKLMLLLKKVENVSQFSETHKIPIRTLWRLRKRGATPSKNTIAKVVAALVKDGICDEQGN